MPMFKRLLHGEGISVRLLDLAGGERALTNLRHLAELLQSAGREVHGGAEGLLRWYRDELLSGRAEKQIPTNSGRRRIRFPPWAVCTVCPRLSRLHEN